MATEDDQKSDMPLVISLDSPDDKRQTATPTSHHSSPTSAVRLEPLQSSLIVTPTGLFPSVFTIDSSEPDLVSPGVHIHLKRPPFENCVRLFRSKLFEIHNLPETAETPDPPTYRLRQWKEAISRMIGLDCLDTRKLNDCYKHDMKTARCPRIVWKEVDTLFNLWRKKLIDGQVKDTLKQTQFKIINAVPIPKRVELLRQVNQSKINWPTFLDLCKEEFKSYQIASAIPYTSDAEEDVIEDNKTQTCQTTMTSRDSPSQLSGQVEDLVSKVRAVEKRWLDAERRVEDSEKRANNLAQMLSEEKSMVNRLKFMAAQQQAANAGLRTRVRNFQKEAEVNKERVAELEEELRAHAEKDGQQGETGGQRERVLLETVRLKSLEIEAKDKEIELLKVQKSGRLRVLEAELAFKSSLLAAREKELELERLKAEHGMQMLQRTRPQDTPCLGGSHDASSTRTLNEARKRPSQNYNDDDQHGNSGRALPTHTIGGHGSRVDGNGQRAQSRGDIPPDENDTENNQFRDQDGTVTTATSQFWENMVDDVSDPDALSSCPVTVKRFKVEID